MMELPSESQSTMSQWLVPLITTLGAGGVLKFYAQWQAGRTAVRAEMQTRVRGLEELVASLQAQIADLREQRGRDQVRIEILQKQVDAGNKIPPA